MNVEQTVRESIVSYPTLFKTGGDVLYFLFCVIGNGYEWVDGEVVTKFPEDSTPWTAEREQERFNNQHGDMDEFVRKILLPHLEATISECQNVVDNVDVLWDDWTLTVDEHFSFYPQTSYALLANVPEDVHEDWQVAAEWAKNLAVSYGWVL